MSNTIIITWVRNGMALGTKWYGTRAHRYEMTRNRIFHLESINQVVNARMAGSITPYSVEDRHVLLFIIVGCLSIEENPQSIKTQYIINLNACNNSDIQ